MLLAFAISVFPVRASSLSFDLNGFGFASPGVQPERIWLQLMISPSKEAFCWKDTPSCYQVFSLILTPASIGSTFSANYSNNPNFATIAGLLTTGAGGYFTFSGRIPDPVPDAGGGIGVGQSFPFPEGWTTDQVDLTINNLSFSTFQGPSPPPATSLQTYTDARFDVTLTVDSMVTPEPATLWIGGVSLSFIGGLRLFRRRSRSKERAANRRRGPFCP